MTLVCDDERDTETDAYRLDHRRARRVEQSRPAEAVDTSTARILHGTTRNVSATGLQITFVGAKAVRPGSILQVHVGRRHDQFCLPNRRQMMPARVVWTRTGDARNEILCGIELLTTLNASRGAA